MGGLLKIVSEKNPWQKTFIADAENGVKIRSFCSPEEIETLSFNPPSVHENHYRPLVTKNDILMKTAAHKDANVVLAIQDSANIVGMGMLDHPSPEDRWSKVGNLLMMEVSIIEVLRSFRKQGLAGKILNLTVDHPMANERIFYMVGYSWTWDLDGHGGAVMDYRNTLIHLFSAEGFKIFQTNEPNVLLRPENLFMARIGEEVPKETVNRFKLARFDLLK